MVKGAYDKVMKIIRRATINTEYLARHSFNDSGYGRSMSLDLHTLSQSWSRHWTNSSSWSYLNFYSTNDGVHYY